ncbi:histidine--tRNA ligase [Candidatus Nanopelagicales bacterium]|nr:histidine--tRNA ligase [Candidatus Nanopelagicales bacterium]
MTRSFSAPKGVPDYVPPRSRDFLHVRQHLAQPAQHAGYQYIELPIFEDVNLFARGVGESSDVVSKEMYTFTDRADRPLALRPEGTAGVMRAVVEHHLERGALPVKLWYAGPFFRAERPQKGRYRQLQQVGVEAIGSDDPAVDAEVIALADEGYRSLGLTGFELLLNSLGCAQCRPAYRDRLLAFLSNLDLDQETMSRARLNPLRVLDDKRPEVKAQLVGAPMMVDHLCVACQSHYDMVREYLRAAGVRWVETPNLVRGLDYYTKTAFEFTHPLLGAQSGIGGGGRYDGLMAQLGGPEMTGIGFGLGTDRTLLACEAEGLRLAPAELVRVYCIPLGTAAKKSLVGLAADLRRNQIAVDMVFDGRALKGAMKAAVRADAQFVVISGDEDESQGVFQVKDMATGVQVAVPRVDALAHIAGPSAAAQSQPGDSAPNPTPSPISGESS